MKIYVDTNVYLDYFLDRKKSKHAFRIFLQTISCRHHIIVLDHLLEELDNHMKLADANTLFKSLRHKTLLVKTEEVDREKAKTISTHYEDALHIILAKKGNAEVIITNNIKDFELLFKTYSPEHI